MPRIQPTTVARSVATALLLTLSLVATLMLAGASQAGAEVHTFKAKSGKHSPVKRFRLVGVRAKAIVSARLVMRRGQRKLPVASVRRAARSRKRVLRVRVVRRGGAAEQSAGSRRRLLRASTKKGPGVLKVTTEPETTITSGPAEGSKATSTSARFTFSSSSRRAKFNCSIDGSAPSRCSSGITYSNLAEGAHHFSVYAEDRRVRDRTPATRTWTVVTAPAPTPDESSPEGPEGPDTVITSGPAEGSGTTETAALFSFTAEQAVGYECALDGSGYSPCSSPKSYSGLVVGSHTFRVRGKDANGEVDPTPARRTWTVAMSGPALSVPGSIADDCSSDVTSQVRAWIDSVADNSTLSFGQGRCYRIEGTLELRDRMLTLDGNGSTFRSLNPPDDQRAIWRLWDSNVAMREMTIDGSYANGGTLNGSLEHAHAVDLRGSHAVIEQIAVSDVAGDCVYFGLGQKRSSGVVRDSSCRRISRNAVSVTAGDEIRVERMTTDRIGYIAFDVEPNSAPGYGSSRVVFNSNTIGSYYMKAYTVIGNAPVRDQEFTNNRVVGQGLKIGVINGSHQPEALRIAGNSTDTVTAPAAMNLDGIRGITVTDNSVPLAGGTLAAIDSSCGIQVSGNSFPGGAQEYTITRSSASC